MPVVATTFRLRRLVDVLLLLSFLAAAVSGVVLFFRPEGSIARWTGWAAFGLDKKHWEAVHIVLVLVLIIAALAHAWLNWRPLVASVLARPPKAAAGAWRLSLGWEFVATLAFVLLACCAAIVSWQPAAAITDLRSLIKDGKFTLNVPPPVTEADKLTVTELCRAASLDERRAVANARVRGIEIRDASQTIAAIARNHDVTPETVYLALRGD